MSETNNQAPKGFLDELASFFAQALGKPTFGVGDSFFAAGGDSLGAADVLTKIDEVYGVELKYKDFLEAPTPVRLGLTVLQARSRAAGKDLASEIAALSAEDATRLVAHLQSKK